MSDGRSIAKVCAHFKVSRDTINKWAQKHPEFAEALAIAKEASQKWFEELALNIATGANKLANDNKGNPSHYRFANAPMLMFLMSRRFPDYYAKKETVLESGAQNKIDTIRSLSREERLAMIGKYKRIIDELAEYDLELERQTDAEIDTIDIVSSNNVENDEG